MGPRIDGTSPAPLQNWGSDSNETYTVQGETSLSEIAAKLHLEPDALAQANPQLAGDANLRPLQTINLPPSSARPQESSADDSEPSGAQSSSSLLPRAPIGDPIARSVVFGKLQQTSEKRSDTTQGNSPAAQGVILLNSPTRPGYASGAGGKQTGQGIEFDPTQPGGPPPGGNRGGPLDDTAPRHPSAVSGGSSSAPGGTQSGYAAGPGGASQAGQGGPRNSPKLGETGADSAGALKPGPPPSSSSGNAISKEEWDNLVSRTQPFPADPVHPPQTLTPDEALRRLGGTDAKTLTNSMVKSHEGHEFFWEKSFGQKPPAPVAYEEGGRIFVDFDRLTPAQQKQVKNMLDGFKGGPPKGGSGSTAAGEGSSEPKAGEGAGKGGSTTEKGMGVASKDTAVTEKGIGAAGKEVSTGVKTVQGFEEAGRAAKIAETTSKIAGAIADMLPGPLDALMLEFDFFTSFAAAHDMIKQRNNEEGFAVGMAAALMGASPDDLKLGAVNSDVLTHVLGAEGLKEKSYNAGLKQGYDYAQSLPPEQRTILRAKAFETIASQGRKWNPDQDPKGIDGSMMTAGALVPAVRDMFEKAREAAERKAIEDSTKNDGVGPWLRPG